MTVLLSRGAVRARGDFVRGPPASRCFYDKRARRAVKDGDSEFDAVFTSPEGRFLGEAEGKDNKAINIDKFSQLERNLHEDFEKAGVREYAKGVLFGNGYRLIPPGERAACFTDKCFTAAKRTKVALIRTPDLFEPARYLKSHKDQDYARRCRQAIFSTEGEVVVFPPIPGEAPST